MNHNTPNFSQVVCSTPPVREAFAAHRPTRFWWHLILWLHGKPVEVSLSATDKTRRVADGFHFYASLYRSLSVVFFALAPVLFLLNLADKGAVSLYWIFATLLAGVYLWGVGGLGHAGATAYATGDQQGTVSLLAFMVMIVAFLSLFVGVISLAGHHGNWIATLPNLVGATALFVFGVGSYLIEIVYLATEQQVA